MHHRRPPASADLLLLLLAAGVGCAARPTAAATSGDQVLTLEDHERTIHLARGDLLTLKLDAVPTTGYSWAVVKNDVALLEPLGAPSFEPAGDPPATGPLGASGRQVLRFRARDPGRQRLELHYRRAWEKKPPLKTFAIEVRVQ